MSEYIRNTLDYKKQVMNYYFYKTLLIIIVKQLIVQCSMYLIYQDVIFISHNVIFLQLSYKGKIL